MGDEQTLFTIKWGDNLIQLSQQMKMLLEGTTLVKAGVVGKRCTMEQVAPRNMAKVTTRHAAITPNDPDFRRRWITMFDYQDSVLFDKQDEMKMLLDPRNAFNLGLLMGANRMKDDILIEAFTATAYTAEDGSTTQAATTTIANGGTGLTLDKMRQIQRTFLENNVDPDEECYLLVGPKDHEDLLKMVETQSTDYNSKPSLVDGKVKYYMGFNIIITNRLTTAAGVTTCHAWKKSGMGLAIAMDPSLSVAQRHDLVAAPWQAECILSAGAARLEEAKVQSFETYHA